MSNGNRQSSFNQGQEKRSNNQDSHPNSQSNNIGSQPNYAQQPNNPNHGNPEVLGMLHTIMNRQQETNQKIDNMQNDMDGMVNNLRNEVDNKFEAVQEDMQEMKGQIAQMFKVHDETRSAQHQRDGAEVVHVKNQPLDNNEPVNVAKVEGWPDDFFKVFTAVIKGNNGCKLECKPDISAVAGGRFLAQHITEIREFDGFQEFDIRSIKWKDTPEEDTPFFTDTRTWQQIAERGRSRKINFVKE